MDQRLLSQSQSQKDSHIELGTPMTGLLTEFEWKKRHIKRRRGRFMESEGNILQNQIKQQIPVDSLPSRKIFKLSSTSHDDVLRSESSPENTENSLILNSLKDLGNALNVDNLKRKLNDLGKQSHAYLRAWTRLRDKFPRVWR